MEPGNSATSDIAGQDTDQLLRFVTVQDPQEPKDRELQRLVRSHAVKQGLQTKRRKERIRSQNFRVVPFNPSRSAQRRPNEVEAQSVSRDPLLASTFGVPRHFPDNDGPNSSNLKILLSSDKAKEALEPVFSLGDNVALQDFRSVFRTDLDDQALLNAVLLTATFALRGNVVDQDCLHYQTRTMKAVRERISISDFTSTISTLGAILLLVGVEMRLHMRPQVELHLKAIKYLVESSRTGKVYLTDGIKRAIFWQDLYAHILTTSERVVDHTTFTELRWQRDMFSPDIFVLPPGFQRRADLFSREFIEVLKDIHAMQCVRESPIFRLEDTISMMHIDNQQAWIQSRLVNLPKLQYLQECCRWAAYLSASLLCCKIWRLSMVPPWISSQLYQQFQLVLDDSVWDRQHDLLAWVLFIGGAFAPIGLIRSGYIKLIQQDYSSKLKGVSDSWPSLVEALKEFIWSEFFASQVKSFWELTFPRM